MSTTAIRCFVKVYAGGTVVCFPLQAKTDANIGALKREIIATLEKDRGVSVKASDYDLAFSKNGTVIQDSSDCTILRNDDFLVFCPKGKSEYYAADSPENIATSYFDLCQLAADDINKRVVQLDGETLTPEDLIDIGTLKAKAQLAPSVLEKIKKSRNVIEEIIKEKKPVYGVSTGFGCFKDIFIELEELSELQENLITSHATGVGPTLSKMRTRMLLALRINVVIKGYSGVRLEIIETMIKALNADCLSLVPEKGSVGASGDLAPLSHLILGLMGQGQMWSPKTGWGPADKVLEANGVPKIQLLAKEGLALNNGTQMITALGAEALYRAEMIAKQSEIIAALTVEVLKGVPEQFAEDIHETRPHSGQGLVAARLRELLIEKDGTLSSLIESRTDRLTRHIQDCYSLRCIPQVHGVVHETLAFVKSMIQIEMNSATDNPLIMINRTPPNTASAGNFHGEYPGKAMDYLAIGVHELANISERRIERFVHPDYNSEKPALDLPGFLVGGKEGLHNGFMISHYTAAALVSENKVLTHPSTVDSITTSGGSEDHVSMGTYAARKALTVVENVEHVLAIELLAACQALDCHRKKVAPTEAPEAPTKVLEKVYNLVRRHVKKLDSDRFMSPDIVTVVRLLQEGKIWDVVKSELPSFPAGVVATFTWK